MANLCNILLLVLMALSVTPNRQYPVALEKALKHSGGNRPQLEKVIEHYSQKSRDCLKLKAAEFMIANMDGMCYYTGQWLDQYLNYLKLVKRDELHGEYIMNAFSEIYGPFSKNTLDKKYDLENIRADDLIRNIDLAFKVWAEQPWGKAINFDEFCETILPFRIDDEVPATNREELYRRFNPLLDSVRMAHGDAVAACLAINKKLKSDGWLFSGRVDVLPHIPAQKLVEYRVGSCREMTDLGVYVMRALGIPVGIDFLPQWPYREEGHNWNTIKGKDGHVIMFMGADEHPGVKHKPGTKKGKVYRHTYALNPESLALQKDPAEQIPRLFTDPRIIDVTDEYAKCFTVHIKLSDTNLSSARHAYLCLFNNNRWVPVAWGKISRNQAVFKKVEGGGIVYLPSYYIGNRIQPAGNPFILNNTGHVQYINFNKGGLAASMVLDRIYPITPDCFQIHEFRGKFEAANNPEFKSPTLIKVLNDKPMPYWNSINFNIAQKFRYIRYVPAAGQHCYIAELAVYAGKKKLNGAVIGTRPYSFDDSTKTIGHAVDNDLTTYFESKYADGSWVGIDLRKPRLIKKIMFAAPIDDPKIKTRVVTGDTYELYYWNRYGQWQSGGSAFAKNGKVKFKTAPANALFVLVDKTRDIDRKRIFTYENGRQIWW